MEGETEAVASYESMPKLSKVADWRRGRVFTTMIGPQGSVSLIDHP